MRKISENQLRSLSSPGSFARGRELYRTGAVYNTFRRGNDLKGKCQGTSAPYYQLHIRMDEDGIQAANCTCPFEWGGYCKHVIALVLTYIHDPQVFIEQKEIGALLKDLDRDVLVSIITKLTENNPDLYAWLQTYIEAATVKSDPAKPGKRQKSRVSRTEIRKQTQGILHSLQGYRMSEAYWMMGGMVEQLRQVIESAQAFLEAGDAEGALTILTVVLTEVSGSYEQFDDSDGELGGFLDDLALPMTEAILSANLSRTEARNLARELEPVIDALVDYGIEELEVVLTALERNWLDMPAPTRDFDPDDNILVEASLNVLERQNRVKDYLEMCLQTGEYRRHILKLIEMGEIKKAVQTAEETLNEAEDSLAVGIALRDSGYMDDALRVAEQGLELSGDKSRLGKWLGPVEENRGQTEQAIRAYLAAFTSQPSLELYSTLRRLSSAEWDDMKPVLMKVLRVSDYQHVLVDVYLFEEEWDRAIAVADKAGLWNYSLIEKVADAVLPFRQDWVIQASRIQAEALIAKTQSKYYAIAAHWLAKMRQAYLSSGRKTEWSTYLDGLKSTYARRPALQAELRKL